jgi:hypothetical protein
MDDHYCPSVFSLQPKHLSSYTIFLIIFHAGAIEFLAGSPEKSTALERWNAGVHWKND